MDDTRAVFWIANEWRYIEESFVSSLSVQNAMPDVTRLLFCPGGLHDGRSRSFFDEIIVLPERKHDMWFLDSVRYMSLSMNYLYDHGVNHALYLDTDTYMCSPVYDLFRSHYTITGAHAPGRLTSPVVEDIPEFFPEINIGVNMMYVPHARSLWKAVYKKYLKDQSIYGNNDQGVLREILWEGYGKYSLYILTPEYNMRLFPCFVSTKVKILHGRSIVPYSEICNQINSSQGMRLWHRDQVLEE